MRMMLKITLPTEMGNRAIKDGTFQKLIEATMTKLKPEASYFSTDRGRRCAMIFFDMQDQSEIPSIAEPWFVSLNAEIEFAPIMNADDVKKGLRAVK